ncbi:DUF1365 domain-containing protein [Pseudonocardia sp. MH-G8]|uniref:DUF1365 domain-containing protein n=1 Tax=Pseudonocardia sp. MH-G8 TaxID=1854588 RepID=UPI000B9FD727|nr:DUF1365 domain-containing protein [Pseudonocardia sp. MH-G8]OZM81217.1 hypothetical protein CFP66_17775 [Pseudonocardia sp. MH-G8]
MVTPTRSAVLYDVEVRHVRRQRMSRAFSHRAYYWLVDLDALPRPPRWLRPFAGFESRDHLGDPGRSIRENLDSWLAGQGVDLRGGRVLMLANARVLGHVFNPITVYWCHDAAGVLACVVAEVHNTYGGRHCYLLHPDDAGRARAAKDFYVSPFLTVEGEYAMRLPVPGERLALAVTLQQQGAAAFTATVTGARRRATPAALARLLLRHPLVTHRTTVGIRRHGIALWLRGLPVVPRPVHIPQEGVQ